MICKHCGATMTRQWFGQYKCEYCGTFIENRDEYNTLIDEYNPREINLYSEVEVNDTLYYRSSKEEIRARVLKQICDNLSQSLYRYIELTENLDFKTGNTKFIGRLKIVNPDAR